MKPIRLLFVVALLITALCPAAFAADPVFPPGVRVGLAPLVGLSRAKSFVGFETEDQSVKVLVAELPAEAYGEVMSAFKANPAGTGGIKPESIETSAGLAYYTAENAKDGANNVRRYSMILPGGTFSGYVAVQVPENASKIYTDEAIRKEVPVEEQLGLMPFKLSELSDFKTVRTLAVGAAMILADGNEEKGFEAAPFMVIGVIGATPAQPEDRGRFANRRQPRFPGFATRALRCPSLFASTASPDMRRASTPPAARTIPPSPWCNGCDSAAPTRFASSEAPRATNGRKHFRASAPFATAFSRADRQSVRRLNLNDGCQATSFGALPLAGDPILAPPLETATRAGRNTRSPIM